MTFYVHTMVMQRTDAANAGWQFTAPNAAIQSWFPAIHSQTQQFRSRTQQLLTLFHHVTQPADAWMQTSLPPPFTPVPAAYAQLLHSFRSKEPSRLALSRSLEYGERGAWMQPFIETIPTFTRGAVALLSDSYRMPGRMRLDLTRQAMAHVAEIARGAFLDVFEIAKFPAIASQTQTFRVRERPKLAEAHRTGPRLDSVIAPVDALIRTILPVILAQSQSFRMPNAPRLDARYLRALDDTSPSIQPSLVPPFDPTTWPALQFLLNSFRMRKGAALDPRLVRFAQSLDWIREPLGLVDIPRPIAQPRVTGGWLSPAHIAWLRRMGQPPEVLERLDALVRDAAEALEAEGIDFPRETSDTSREEPMTLSLLPPEPIAQDFAARMALLGDVLAAVRTDLAADIRQERMRVQEMARRRDAALEALILAILMDEI